MTSNRIAIGALALLVAACGPGETEKNNENNTTSNNTTSNNATSNNTANNTTSNNDDCVNLVCGTGDPVCDGNTLVTFEDDDDECCPVEVRTDCTATDQVCMGGECVEEDECALVDCTPAPPPMCDGSTAVFHADVPDNCCPVEMREDCAANSQVCSNGMCVAPGGAEAPAAGDIAITEFIKNPVEVSDDAGEWLELFNASAKTLDLQGLKLRDTGGDEFVFPIGDVIELAPGGYFVVGASDDMAANGGAPVDLAYADAFVLANGSDEIILLDAGDAELDRVEYNDTDWLDPTGFSLQFGSENDAAVDDNADAGNWCLGQGVYGDGDVGTPGAANADCTPVDRAVQELGDENDANNPEVGQSVNVSSLAISAIDAANGYIFAQDPTGGEYSGLYIDAGAVDVSAFAAGDVIDVSGAYIEDYGSLVTVVATAVTDTGSDTTVAPQVFESSALADEATADPWEGVLVQIVEAGVTTAANNFGEATVDGALAVDDLLFDGFTTASVCDVYEFVVGPLNYSFGAHKILPRDADDLGAVTAATQTTDVASVGTTGFAPKYICITAGDTVTWTNPDAIPHTVTQRLASEDSANNTPATPLFDEALPANGTATVTFADSGTFHYRCTPHAAMEGAVVVPD